MSFSRWSSRKFALCCYTLVTAGGLLLTGHISGGEYITLTTLAFGLFCGSNVWEKK